MCGALSDNFLDPKLPNGSLNKTMKFLHCSEGIMCHFQVKNLLPSVVILRLFQFQRKKMAAVSKAG